MHVHTLTATLNREFAAVYQEFAELCRGNLPAASLLSKLLYWTGVAESTPEKCGWIYKSAADLRRELGLTRRGYEKARKLLVGELGVMQYRRGGVHGVMHWRIELPELLKQVYEKVKKQPVPQNLPQRQRDKDGWWLEEYIPADLWNTFLIMREAEGKPASAKYKAKLFQQLKVLRKKGADLSIVIQASINNKSGFFTIPTEHWQEINAKKTQQEQAEKTRKEFQAYLKAKEQEEEAKRSSTDPPDKAYGQSMLDKLKNQLKKQK
ncbi:hypothetical protein [Neisseria zoodegmatis]|uniref:Replication protein n=1 Tax=Neisseria zoodegmatis TaxID=326523 RepID=A0AB38DRZ3_9NEIS|nr:hypothetical protein [Neisseria zoodegmatis]OSI10939.1 hypothetical protein BWD10_03230 [Neisseria zoodegmatis]SNU80175.1 Uncharacterised protein [Neisseria zoodegmatis]